jgi:hypothetical protein
MYKQRPLYDWRFYRHRNNLKGQVAILQEKMSVSKIVIFNAENKVDYAENLKKVILSKIFDNPFIPWKRLKLI